MMHQSGATTLSGMQARRESTAHATDHMWEDCPNEGSTSDGDSTDSSVPLKDWSKELEKAGFKGVPPVKPFDPTDPDMRACHSSEKLADVPIMLTGDGAIYECQTKGMTVFNLWTRQDLKALLDLKFSFSKKMRERRISQLSSRNSKSKENRKILDDIYLSVTGYSLAVKRLWLSIYAGCLRIIPDVRQTRHTRDTAQLLADQAERRVRELPQSMQQAKAVSEHVMTHLKGASEILLAAEIETAAAVVHGLYEAIYAELSMAEKDTCDRSRKPESLFMLWHYYIFRGTVADTEELEEQWAQDERLREKMHPGITIEEWRVIHTENRRRWLENSGGRTIDPIADPTLLASAEAEGISEDEVFTWERYLRLMNTLSSSPYFKRLKHLMDESSRKDYKE